MARPAPRTLLRFEVVDVFIVVREGAAGRVQRRGVLGAELGLGAEMPGYRAWWLWSGEEDGEGVEDELVCRDEHACMRRYQPQWRACMLWQTYQA